MLRRVVNGIAWTILVLFVLLLVAGSGGTFLFEIPITLAFGWISFLRHNLGAMQPNGLLVAEALACILALGVGGHYFARWLWREMAPAGSTSWRARWTVLGLATVVLLFVAGIATIGLTHQATWLFNAEGPLVEDAWRIRWRISAGLSVGKNAQGAVTAYFARTGRLPGSSAEAGYEAPKDHPDVDAVEIGPTGRVTVTISRNVGGGGLVHFTPIPAGENLGWKCSSTFLPRYVPVGCRDTLP